MLAQRTHSRSSPVFPIFAFLLSQRSFSPQHACSTLSETPRYLAAKLPASAGAEGQGHIMSRRAFGGSVAN